jgi:endonuclease/exonuclease/phosphatase family metal-dependent hydrolase
MSTELSVLSWNVLITNTKQKEALSFLATSGADCICLQEVPQEWFSALMAMPYHFARSTDAEYLLEEHNHGKGIVQRSLVVLTKHPIQAQESYPLPELEPRVRWQTRLLYGLFRSLGVWTEGPSSNRTQLAVDVQVGSIPLRIITAHLPLTTPTARARELAVITSHLIPSGNTIVAGDFNCIESAFFKILNWLQGGKVREGMPWYDERTAMEKLFSKAGLQNPFRGMSTFPLAQSQLDHILIPTNARVLERAVIQERFGSDHRPILLTVSLS